MPLARIDLMTGKSPEYKRALADGVYRALMDAAGVPEHDQFAVVAEHDADGLIYDREYLGVERSDDIVFVQITLNAGRTLAQKQALYARIVELFAEDPGVRPQDVLINLVEVDKVNWSFGDGVAQYA